MLSGKLNKLQKNFSFDNFTIGYLVIISLLIAFIIYNEFILCKYVFFFSDVGSDSIKITLPNYIGSANLHKKDGFFTFWSFYSGMGKATSNPITLNPFAIMTYLLVSIFGYQIFFYRNLVYLFFYIIPSGIFAYLYFRTLKISKFAAFIGGLLFEFSGYMIIGSQWGHAFKIFYFIFLIFAYEYYLTKKKWWLLPIAFYFLADNAFLLITFSFFLLIYSYVRFYDTKSKKFIKYILFMLPIAGFGLLGIAMNAPHFLSTFLNMIQSPRVLGSERLSAGLIAKPQQGDPIIRLISTILRFFANDLLGTGSNFTGWRNYLEAPIFYIGLLPITLFPIFFKKAKNKILHLSFLGFWLIVAFVPIVRHAVNLFMGDYYKNTIDIFVPFVILFYGILSLNKIENQTNFQIKNIILPFIICLILVNFPYSHFAKTIVINQKLQLIVSLFILGYFFIFLLWNKKNKFAKYSLLLLTVIELSYISYPAVNNREIYTRQDFKKRLAGYNDATIDALAFIRKNDKSSFYRIEKDYGSCDNRFASFNDAKAQNFFSTKSHGSFNQLNYIKFLEYADMIKKGNERQTRYCKGTAGNNLLMTFASVKYFIVKNQKKYKSFKNFKPIYQKDNITILKNVCYLPFGFSYETYITKQDYLKLNKKQRQRILLKAIVLDSADFDFKKINKNQSFDTSQISNGDLCSDVAKLKENVFKIKSFKHKKIEGTIKLNADKFVFFTIPYDKGWTFIINNKKYKPFKANIGFMAVYLPKGEYKITLYYLPPYFYITLTISILSIVVYLFLLIKNKKNDKTYYS